VASLDWIQPGRNSQPKISYLRNSVIYSLPTGRNLLWRCSGIYPALVLIVLSQEQASAKNLKRLNLEHRLLLQEIKPHHKETRTASHLLLIKDTIWRRGQRKVDKLCYQQNSANRQGIWPIGLNRWLKHTCRWGQAKQDSVDRAHKLIALLISSGNSFLREEARLIHSRYTPRI